MRSTYAQNEQQNRESRKVQKASNQSALSNPRRPQKQKQKKKKGAQPRHKEPTNFIPTTSELKLSQSAATRMAAALHGINEGHETHTYYKGLSKPFVYGRGVKSTMCYNEAPSFVSATATSTSTWDNVTVAAGTSTMLVFFPGHSKYYQQAAGVGGSSNPATSSQDPTAYHSFFQKINATRYVMGPVEVESVQGSGNFLPSALGVYVPNLSLGSFTDFSDVGGAVPIGPDVGLPYRSTGEQMHGEHLRFQLSNMAIKFANTTTGANRGGNVVTVQPDMTMLPATAGGQSALKMYRSWYNHGVAEKLTEVAWVPRFEDQAFWHCNPVGHVNALDVATTNTLNGGGIFLFLNNTTSVVQTYVIESIYNFELAGANVSAVSTSRPLNGNKDFNETVVSITRQTQNGASSLLNIATKASAAIATGRSVAAQFGISL